MKNARSVSSRLNYKGLFPDREVALAKALIWKQCSEDGRFKPEDFENDLQEVMIHWLEARDQFDSERGEKITSYMRKVVRGKLIDLVRERNAKKRSVLNEAVPLDAPVGEDDDGETFVDLLEDSTRPNSDLSIDLATSGKRLTPRQSQICAQLKEGLTVVEISEALGCARCTVHDEIRRIRRIFTDLSLRDYLMF